MTQPEPDIPVSDQAEQLNKQFSYRKVLWVIALSLVLSGYLIFVSFDVDAFRLISWTANSLLLLFLGYILLGIRHLAYMYRIRHLTNKHLSWRQSFEVITLWLFSSAVTPSTVGGAAVAVYLLKRKAECRTKCHHQYAHCLSGSGSIRGHRTSVHPACRQ